MFSTEPARKKLAERIRCGKVRYHTVDQLAARALPQDVLRNIYIKYHAIFWTQQKLVYQNAHETKTMHMTTVGPGVYGLYGLGHVRTTKFTVHDVMSLAGQIARGPKVIMVLTSRHVMVGDYECTQQRTKPRPEAVKAYVAYVLLRFMDITGAPVDPAARVQIAAWYRRTTGCTTLPCVLDL